MLKNLKSFEAQKAMVLLEQQVKILELLSYRVEVMNKEIDAHNQKVRDDLFYAVQKSYLLEENYVASEDDEAFLQGVGIYAGLYSHWLNYVVPHVEMDIHHLDMVAMKLSVARSQLDCYKNYCEFRCNLNYVDYCCMANEIPLLPVEVSEHVNEELLKSVVA